MIQEPDPAVDAGVVQERGAELSEFLRGRRARLKPSDYASPEILDAWAPLVIEDPERHGDVDPEARASSAAVTSAPAGSTCR
ncbi:hypothetical protein [Streptomyces sp. SD31]|uniref:hypothetical protein n=1 Tax=Streptomyces sp. SD31 TaxID=3452208 RepID=UPI003F8CE533